MNINPEFSLHKSNSKKPYFEGWYYRITTATESVAIILGITQNTKDDHAFIQTLDTITNQSHYTRYELEDVYYTSSPFHITIENNHFYEDCLIIHMDFAFPIHINVTFYHLTPLTKSLYAPTIMGPFSYLPRMQCIHSIHSLHHTVKGSVQINHSTMPLNTAIGYIEKDRGTSFPSKYLWLQSNFSTFNSNTCFFLSIATIPMKAFSFTGCIGVLLIDDEQIRFATYYGAKVHTVKPISSGYKIIMTQGDYLLTVKVYSKNGFSLLAPSFGNMETTVTESLVSDIVVHLYKKGRFLATLKYAQVGFEVFGY